MSKKKYSQPARSGGVENPSTHLSQFRPGLGNDKVRGGCPGLGKSFKLMSRTSTEISTGTSSSGFNVPNHCTCIS